MRAPPVWYYYLVSAAFGLVFGSFFNVVICRLPEGESLGDRSRCPGCGSPIRWYDNVPLVSFVVLRGRCRACGMRISWRYPVVELTTAALFALAYWWSFSVVPVLLGVPGGRALQPELFLGLLLVSVLVLTSAVDLERGIIPNRILLVGIPLMLALAVGLAVYRGEPARIAAAVGTSLAGALFFLAAGLLYGALFMSGRHGEGAGPDVPERGAVETPRAGAAGAGSLSEEPPGEEGPEITTGMGMGDVKLMLFTGLALGYFHWYFLPVHVFISALAGFLAFVVLKFTAGMGRKDRIPFGPFLAVGALVTLAWGQALVDLYIRLLR